MIAHWIMGLCLGFTLGFVMGSPATEAPAKECPNGAIGQVIHADGSTYCSYMGGKYRAQVTWKEI